MNKDLTLVLRTSVANSNTSLSGQLMTFSPVTDLAMSFSDLINDGFAGTPRATICFDDSVEATPNVVSRSLKPVDLNKEFSQDIENTHHKSSSSQHRSSCSKKRSFDLHKNASSLEIRSAAFRRFKSLPRPFADLDDTPDKCPSVQRSLSPSSFSPECLGQNVVSPPGGRRQRGVSTSSGNTDQFSLHDDEESSQDSGLGLDKAQSPFAKPCAPAPRVPVPRSRVLSDNTNILNAASPKIRQSSSSPDFTQHFKANPLKKESPDKLRKSSLTCSPETDEGDDGFLDLLETDDDDEIPKGLEGLIHNPVLSTGRSKQHAFKIISEFTPGLSSYNQENIRTRKTASRRGLFRSPSTPACINDQCSPLGQTTRNQDNNNAVLYKKRKSISGHSEIELNKADKLPRCSSEAEIISVLDAYDTDNVIGDFTKPYCLPTIVGSHRDLKCITPDTLAQVIEGHYNDTVERFTIIDCRYPYEFEGGHIKNAVNIWERSNMIEFHKTNDKPSTIARRNIIIFHCEFSSERAPKMSRFLREIDRASNKECYPSLGFPELYTLEGGYKAFYNKHKELCEPQKYKPMLHENHIQDLRHFRAKSKSWAGEKESKTSFRNYKQYSF